MNEETLEQLRNQIDGIDEEIVKSIGRRLRVVAEIKVLKQRENFPDRDSQREVIILQNLSELSKKYNIPFSVIEQVYALLIARATSGM